MLTKSLIKAEEFIPIEVMALAPFWLVGGAARWLIRRPFDKNKMELEKYGQPNDWDLLVERADWPALLDRLQPTLALKNASATRFGGLTVQLTKEIRVDMWPGCLEDYVKRAELPDEFFAVHLPSRLTLHGTPFRLENRPLE